MSNPGMEKFGAVPIHMNYKWHIVLVSSTTRKGKSVLDV